MMPSQPPSTRSISDLHQQPINLNEVASVNYWLAALDCSELELRVAVAEVGALGGDVGNRLGKVL